MRIKMQEIELNLLSTVHKLEGPLLTSNDTDSEMKFGTECHGEFTSRDNAASWKPSIAALLETPGDLFHDEHSACESYLGPWVDDQYDGGRTAASNDMPATPEPSAVARAMLAVYMRTREYARQVQSVIDFAAVHGQWAEKAEGGINAAHLGSISDQLASFLTTTVEHSMHQYPYARGSRRAVVEERKALAASTGVGAAPARVTHNQNQNPLVRAPPRYYYTFCPFQLMAAEIISTDYAPGSPSSTYPFLFLSDPSLHSHMIDMLRTPVLVHEWEAVKVRVRQLRAVAVAAGGQDSHANEPVPVPPDGSIPASQEAVLAQTPHPPMPVIDPLYTPSPALYVPFAVGFSDSDWFSYDDQEEEEQGGEGEEKQYPPFWWDEADAVRLRARKARAADRAAIVASQLRPVPIRVFPDPNPAMPLPHSHKAAVRALDVLDAVDVEDEATVEACDALRAHFEGLAMDILFEIVASRVPEDLTLDDVSSVVCSRLLTRYEDDMGHERLEGELHTPECCRHPLYMRLAYTALCRVGCEGRPDALLSALVESSLLLSRGMLVMGRQSGRSRVQGAMAEGCRAVEGWRRAGAGLGPGGDEGYSSGAASSFGADELLPATLYLVLQAHAARVGYGVWRRGVWGGSGSLIEGGVERMLLGCGDGTSPIVSLPSFVRSAFLLQPGLRLPSTAAYIQRFRDGNALMGSSGYTLTSLRSALAYLAHAAGT